MSHHDIIVLGTGGVGSAAFYHLASRGIDVLGIDRFPPGHDRGSSHGHTRIIRQAYFEHPNYVPLVRRAYKHWHTLEEITGEQLFVQTGLLQVGAPQGTVVAGVLRSAADHKLKVDRLTRADMQAQYPQFTVPEGYEGVFEPSAGCLYVERCVEAYAKAAAQWRGTLRVGETVKSWSADEKGVTVETDRERYTGGRLIFTAGAWARDLLQDLGLKLRVLRKHLYWYQGASDQYHAEQGAPAYLFELPHGVFYGVPQFDARGLKVAEHSGGVEVSDPLHDARAADPADEARVESFVRAHLPGVSGPISERAVCFYTMSPDEHFIVDRHPQYERVSFACGLSGHGFKFTSVLGEALAHLALEGKTDLPIEFLGLNRPGLSDET